MYGGETDPMFVDCAEALHAVLPRSTVLRLPGLNHDSAQTYGKPETIAAALRLFFTHGRQLTAMHPHPGKRSKELLAEVGTRRAPVSQ